MHEDVGCPLAARQEAETAHAIEPLDHGSLPVALRLDDDVGPLRQLRGINRSALVHAQDAERLHTLWSAQHLAMNSSSFVRGLVAAGPEARHVQQDIGKPVVRHNKSVPLRCVKPLDRADNLEHLDAGFFGSVPDTFDRMVKLRKIGTLRIPHLRNPATFYVAMLAARRAEHGDALFMFAPGAKRSESTISRLVG